MDRPQPQLTKLLLRVCALYNIGKSLKQCNLEDAKSLHLPSTCITLIKLFTWLGTDNLYKQKMHSSREDNKECLTEYIYEKKKKNTFMSISLYMQSCKAWSIIIVQYWSCWSIILAYLLKTDYMKLKFKNKSIHL